MTRFESTTKSMEMVAIGGNNVANLVAHEFLGDQHLVDNVEKTKAELLFEENCPLLFDHPCCNEAIICVIHVPFDFGSKCQVLRFCATPTYGLNFFMQ